MTGHEQEPQQVVADIVFARGVQRLDEVGREMRLERFEIGAQRFVRARMRSGAPQAVERAMLRGGHEPCSRVGGDAARGPAFERRDERVLSGVLGQSHVVQKPRGVGDHLGGFDAPDGGNRAMCRGLSPIVTILDALLVRYAVDGLWLADLLGAPVIDAEARAAMLARLLALSRS